METVDDSILFASNAEAAAQVASAALARRGFRVMRSFDMRSALAAHADCACSDHGTAQCTCQFIVLLACWEETRPGELAGAPAVITAHSRNEQGSLQIVCDDMSGPDPALAAQVRAALVEAAAALPAASRVRVAADAA